MCGILFCTSTEAKTCKAIHRRYKKQRSRGINGFGYLTIKGDRVEHLERATTEDMILSKLKNETAPSILFHHRTPTSTPNYVEATHPFFISDPRFNSDYYIIHNGVISNWEALFEKYKKDNYIFRTEMREASSVRFPHIEDSRYEFDEEIKINDSEALAIDLAKYFENLSDTIESRGSIAFIAIKATKDGKIQQLIYGHNDGNPLKIEKDNTLMCLKSDGHGENVPVDIIHYMDWDTKNIVLEPKQIGDYYGRKTMGYNTPTNVPPRSSSNPSLWTKKADGTWGAPDHVRHLHPTHPLLPGSLKEMGAAMARTKSLEDANAVAEHSEGKDDERASDFEQSQDARVEYEDSALENYDHTDYDEMSTEAGINILLGEMNNDSPEATFLRKDLRRAAYNAGGAQREVEDARDCLKAVIASSGSIEDMEAARGLLQAAETSLSEYRREINNISAELSAWV